MDRAPDERDGIDPVEMIELDRPPGPTTSFTGRIARRPALLRIAAVLGAAAAVVLSAALTMAASPAPSAATRGSAPSPGAASGPSTGGPWMAPGMGFGRGMLKGGPRGFFAFGAITITAIDGSSLSLKTDDGWTRTITVGSSTKITRGGQTIALGDLKVGDQVRFQESRDQNGTFTITAIDVVLPHVEGIVGSVTGIGFTVKGADGTTTSVVVNGSTVYRLGRGTGSRSDVKVGDRVAVQGTKAADGTITATTVQVAPASLAGVVTAKTSSSITIRLPGGTTATVKVSSSTTYRVAGKPSASLNDIAVGDRIVAQGTQNADGSLQASAVASMGARGRGWGPGAAMPGGAWPAPGMMGPGMRGPGLPIVPNQQG